MLFDKALISKSSVWCPDLSASNYVLSTCATTSNIRGAIAIPVFQNKILLGVIELYSPKILDPQPDSGLLEVMSTLGNQFSFFIERRESHLLDTELNLIIRNSSDAIYKRLRFIEEYTLGTEDDFYDVLSLFNQNVEYVYNLKTKVCTKQAISRPWRE
jgi:GAF domain-containing protein